MICPTCKHPTFVVEYQKIELDYCGNCQGVWFDAGELELMLDSAGIGETKSMLNTLLQSPPASTNEKKRKCPICRRAMKKVNIGGTDNVIIDTCGRQDGFWFDAGEIDHLIKFLADKSPEKSGTGKVFSFIKEVFQAK
ncbi:MAG TPA: zf-TFIIB domain-containing protein [Dehalococcoidales bacterium]